MALSKRSDSDLRKDPLISIITPVLNCEDLLENHIQMVKSQTYSKIEHIIIDGGSSDNTVDILKLKNNEIDYWISEPDQGIYDAMNKGVDAANGRWLFFAGVDDNFLSRQTLEQVFKRHKIAAATQLICGKVIRSDGKLIKSRFNNLLYYKNTLPHQGVFYRRDIFEDYRYSGFKKKNQHHFYKISGDYHLNLFLFMNGVKHQFLDCVIMRCGHGKSMAGSFTGYLEEIIIRHFFIGHSKSIIFDLLSVLRYFRQRFFIN
ncbi:MAG: glycosyltransferase [Desulfobacteraceae bacterium]|nr:glycosyltransferase [Desulfobacteraceae bacterium]MBC2754904.1 glycosyltransferase [Desulfobacteraceae bacterium]